MLEPKTFPTAMACFPFRAAETLTTTSGREVPSASKLIDMRAGLMPKSVAIVSIDDTVYFAPRKINIPETIMMA